MGLRQILARLGFVFTIARLSGYPCAARDSVKLDLIAGIYGRAGARILTLVFGLHSFDHGLPFNYLGVGVDTLGAEMVNHLNSFSVWHGRRGRAIACNYSIHHGLPFD